MKLLTKVIENKVPSLYSTDGLGNKAVVCAKFFTPDSSFTWYLLELDKETKDCFGLVTSNLNYYEPEYGYFSLNELMTVKGPMGLSVERDMYFDSMTVGELKKESK